MSHPSSLSPPFDRQRLAQLRPILEALPVGVSLTDRQGHVLIENPAFARIWGRRPSGTEHRGRREGWWPATGKRLAPDDWPLARVLATGEPVLGELIAIVAAEGRRTTIRSSALPLRDAAGDLEGVLLIAEETVAQAALDERERDYRAFFDLVGVGVGEVDLATGRYLRVNRYFCQFTGYSETELLDRTIVDLVPPEARAATRASLERAQAGPRLPWSGEQHFRRKDGTLVPAWISVSYIEREDGSVRSVATVQDLTQQKAAAAALRRSEAEYRALFELAGVAKTEIDLATGRYLRVNRKYCEFTGYAEAELLGMTLSDLIFPEDRAGNDARIARALAGERDTITFERRYRRKDGTAAWGLVSLAYIEGPEGQLHSLATIQDIGERKEAEAALYLQDERMALALRAASVIMFTQDRDLRYTWLYNPFVSRAVMAQGLGKTDEEMMPPDEAARLRPIKQRVLEEGGTLGEESSARQTRDGIEALRHFHSTYQPLRAATGEVVGLIGIVIDISDRKEAEEKLRRSEERLRVALASSPVTVYAQDRDLRYTFMYNPSPGYDAEATLGRTDAELLAPEDAARLAELKRRVLATGEQVRAEVQATGALGRHFFDLTVEPLRDADGAISGVTGAAFDITERKRREQRDRLLAQAGEVLGMSLDVDLALRAITDLLVPTLADWCVVSTIEDGWVVRRAARHVDPAGAEFLRTIMPRYRLDETQSRGIARVIATGQPFFRAEGSLADEAPLDDRDLQRRQALGVPGAVSQIVVPLLARGRVLGAINACLGPGARRFEAEDLALLQELAARAALSLDNAHLYAAERAAREAAERATARTLRLQVATAALTTALTLDEVARVAAESFLNVLGARGSLVSLLDLPGEALELLHAANVPRALQERLRRVPLDQLGPLAAVARSGEPIFLDSSEEAARRFPGPGLRDRLEQGDRSWAFVPLTVGGQLLGSLAFSFDRPHALDEGDRALTLAIADLCAQAIERARLHAVERSTRSRLQQIVEALPEAILVVDARGRFTLANTAAIAILGFDPTGQPLPLAGDSAYRAFGARQPDGTPYPAEELPLERAVLRGETTQGEQLILRNAATGVDVPVLVSAAPLRDPLGQIDGGLAAFQDITTLKTLERIRDGFYAAVSHDLKNPLTIIRAHTQLTQRQLGRLDPATAAPLVERLDTVVAATGRMNQLLGDLLDHARLQAGEPLELQLQPTDLGAMLRRLAEQWGQASDRHRFAVRAGSEALILAVDPRRFERVLDNLLSNAVKYSPEGGEVDLAAHVVGEPDRAWVEVTVRDNGIGIPADDLPHIFQPYRRGGNVRDQIAGSGLGLASARQLIEQHGGTITVTSAEGEGTTVHIRLPHGARLA